MSLPSFGGGNRLQEAMRLLQQGNASGAISLLETEIHENPQNGSAFQYLGVARSQQGDIGGGIMALREASRLMPRNASVLYNLGVALAQAKQADEAKTVLMKSLEIEPANAKVRSALERLGYTAPPAKPSATAVNAYDLGLDTASTSPSQPPAYPVQTPMSSLGGIGGGASSMPTTNIAPASSTPSPLGAVGGGMSSLGTIGGGAPSLGTIGGASNVSTTPSAELGAVGGSDAPAAMGMTARPMYSSPLPTASSTPMGGDAVAGGMYVPPAAISPQMMGREPSTGEKFMRGAMWGALYCQMWSLWTIGLSIALPLMATTKSEGFTALAAILISLIIMVIFAVIGAILGLIIAAINGDESSGSMVGITTAVLLIAANFFLFRGQILVGIFFWFVSGRFIGTSVGKKIQERIGI